MNSQNVSVNGQEEVPEMVDRRAMLKQLGATALAMGIVLGKNESAEAQMPVTTEELREQFKKLSQENAMIKTVDGAMWWADRYGERRMNETIEMYRERNEEADKKIEPVIVEAPSKRKDENGELSSTVFYQFKAKGKVPVEKKDGSVVQVSGMNYIVASNYYLKNADNLMGLLVAIPAGTNAKLAEGLLGNLQKRV